MSWKAYNKENPLDHGAIVIWICLGIEPKFVFLIVMLSEVEKDSRRFEDGEVVARAIHYSRDTAVGVEFDKPRFLKTKSFSSIETEGNRHSITF